LISSEEAGASSLQEFRFISRGAEVAALLREPSAQRPEGFPGVVLLPGATVTKEQEQGLAELLSGLGYATIALDQRNRGGVDVGGDLEMFLNGQEPTGPKMVHDALAAAEVLRMQPEIDPARIVYLGESNGGRFAIIASALDRRSRGVVAISTSGYGVEEEIVRFVCGAGGAEVLQIHRSRYLSRENPAPKVRDDPLEERYCNSRRFGEPDLPEGAFSKSDAPRRLRHPRPLLGDGPLYRRGAGADGVVTLDLCKAALSGSANMRG
jgi:hypothetical protein